MELSRIAAVIVLLAGCGDSGSVDGPDGSTPDGGLSDAAPSDAGTSDSGPIDAGRDAGRADAALDAGTTDAGSADGNSFATAKRLPVDGEAAMEAIDPAGDHDFFEFDGSANTWVGIQTSSNADGDGAMADTVLRLYDSTMTRIAENDDAVPRVSTDSEILIRLPRTGTYYVEVLEWSEWAEGETPVGGPGYDYSLEVGRLGPGLPTVTPEIEAGDDGAAALVVPFYMDFQLIIAAFDHRADVDVYELTIPAGAPKTLNVVAMPTGNDGYGSTTDAGEIWLTDGSSRFSGEPIIGRIDQSAGYDRIAAPLEAGDYLLWVSHHGGDTGDNPFYAQKVYRNEQQTGESGADNDTLELAEELALEPVPDEPHRVGYFLAHLDTDTDVDYLSFDVMSGEAVTVACDAEASGSGVRGLAVEVQDDAGGLIDEATETIPDGAVLRDLALDAGTHYVRLSKEGQDTEVMGDWVHCAVAARVL